MENRVSGADAVPGADADVDEAGLTNRLLRKAETAIQSRTSRILAVIERCTDEHNYSAVIRTAEALGVQHIWLVDPVELTVNSDGGGGNEANDDGGGGDAEGDAEGDGDKGNEKSALTAPTCGGESGGDTLDRKGGHGNATREMHKLFARRAHEFTTIREFTTTAECIAALREEGRTIWATDLSQHAVCLTEPALRAAAAAATTAAAAANVEPNAPPGPSSSLTSTSLTPAAEWATSVVPNKLAIVFGTESVGCTEEILTAADLRVYLPLRGFADSLNLSVAAALVMHELFHLCPEAIGEMSDAERATLREKWFTQLAVGRVQTRAEGKRAKDVQAKLTRVRKKRKEMSSLGGATGLGAGAVSVRAAARAVARADVGPTGGAVVAVGGVHDVSDLKAVEAALVAEAAAIEAGRWAAARAVVAPHLANPPAVLRDMRRPDAHREAFVGPSVRARNAEHWAGMAAVAHSSGLAVGEAQPKSRREGGVGDDPATATGGGGE